MIEPSWLAGTQPSNDDLPLWTRALVGDMLPEALSPLGWSLIWEPCAGQGWRDCLIHRFGFDDEEIDRVAPETVFGFGGFVYLNATVLRVWADRTPNLAVDHVEPVLVAGSKPPPAHQPPPWEPDSVTIGMLGQWYDWVVRSRSQSELHRLVREVDATVGGPAELTGRSDADLVAEAVELQGLCRRLFSQHLNQTLASLIGPRLVNNACIAVGQPAHTLRLLSGLGQVDPVGPTLALWELSRLVRSSTVLSELFAGDLNTLDERLRQSREPDPVALIAGVEALVEEIGFRGPNEWDLASATWDVAPDIVLAMIDCLRRCDDGFAPKQRRHHLEADRYRLTVEIAAALDEEDRAVFVDAVESAVAFIRGREMCRTAMMKVIHRMRVLVRAVAVRACRRGDLAVVDDIWLVTSEELGFYADGELADIRLLALDRAREYAAIAKSEPPPMLWFGPDDEWQDADDVGVITGGEPSLDALPMEPGDLMLGLPGSPGMAQGRARVIETVADLADFQPGEVMVLARPVLATTPIFVAAGAVITDFGDTFAHAVVVARELGTPMVVGAKGASDRIPNGALVNVDGLTGVVSVVEGPVERELSLPRSD